METSETALQNIIDAQGWQEGAATPERRSGFLNRRMAQLALEDVDLTSDDDFTELAA